MTQKILCVDDEPNVLAGYQRSLHKQFKIDVAVGGEQAITQIQEHGPYAVVIADMQMPRMNGIQFLRQVQAHWPDTVRLMLTGNADQKTAVDAVNEGQIFRFLTKPCTPDRLAGVLEASLAQFRLITVERELLEKTVSGSIKALTEILAMVEPQTFGRSEKTRNYMHHFGAFLKYPELWELGAAGMLAQIGLVTVPAAIAVKACASETLAGREKDVFNFLPETTARLLAHIPRLEPVASIVRYQFKHFDGSGFPADSVKGEEIPLGARMLKLLSDLIKLEERGNSHFKALHQLRATPGVYDPTLIEAALRFFEIFNQNREEGKPVTVEVTLAQLKINHILVGNVTTLDGVRIVAAGTLVSQAVLEKLQNFASISGVREPLLVEGNPVEPHQ